MQSVWDLAGWTPFGTFDPGPPGHPSGVPFLVGALGRIQGGRAMRGHIPPQG